MKPRRTAIREITEYTVDIDMLRVQWRSLRWRAISAITLAIPLLAIALVVWRASDARKEAAAEVLSKSEFPYRVIPVDRTAPPAVDTVAAVPGFRDLATYKDMIAVSARAGLFLYERSGALQRQYRTGIELPPAEPGSMSVGIAAGSVEPELFIATRGEGLLAFNGARFRQILPADAGLRTVTSVLVLGSGRILLGTERQGVLVFDGRRPSTRASRRPTSRPSPAMTAISGSAPWRTAFFIIGRDSWKNSLPLCPIRRCFRWPSKMT